MYNINVNENVEKKGKFNYLSWAHAWKWFVEQYPNAKYTVAKDENNKCYFGDKEVGYMVYTTVTVDELTHEMWLPVMDYSNKAIKAPTMMDINKAVMRCLVKNLAMFGLGLYIYAGEDLPEEENQQPENKIQQPDKISTKQLIDLAKEKGYNEAALLAKYTKETGKTCTEVKFIPAEFKKSYYNQLQKVKK